MLDMGFKDELEKIFAAMGKTVDRQLLLFSATLPPWVKKIAGVLPELFIVGGDRPGRWWQRWVEQNSAGFHGCETYLCARVLLESKPQGHQRRGGGVRYW